MGVIAVWQHSEDLSVAIGMIRGLITRSEMVGEAPVGGAGMVAPGAGSKALSDPLRTPPAAKRTSLTQHPRTDHPSPFGYEGDD